MVTTFEDLENLVSAQNLSLKSLTRDEDYTKYEFLLENSLVNQQKYLVFGVMMIESLDFLSFYVGPES